MRRYQRQCSVFGMALAALFVPVVVMSAPDDVERAPVQNQAQNQFFMDDNNLEANVFQPHGNAKQARAGLESRLKLQLDEMQRVCGLSDQQIHKLKLAASNDVRRFFEEFEGIRKKYRSGKQDQQAWNNVWQEIQPLQAKMQAGLFGETSFFAKATRNVLSDEQLAKYEAVDRERRKMRYQAMIEVVMETVENSVPLRSEQHEAIAAVLLSDTPAPLKFGQFDQHFVLFSLSKVREEKLKALLDERQWKQMQVVINQSRGMGQFLVQNGVLAKEDFATKRTILKVKRQIKPAERSDDAAGAAKSDNKQAEK